MIIQPTIIKKNHIAQEAGAALSYPYHFLKIGAKRSACDVFAIEALVISIQDVLTQIKTLLTDVGRVFLDCQKSP